MTDAVTSRENPRWYTPSNLPEELTAFDETLEDALGVGAVGKVGLLDLALSRAAGLTRVRRHYQRAPLHVYRPIYLDDRQPDMAFLFVQQFGEGLVQGDRYRIDIDCGPGSATHITTQAATNIYGAQRNFATQLVNLRAGAGAVLEYLPGPVVPFRGARVFQRTSVTAARTSVSRARPTSSSPRARSRRTARPAVAAISPSIPSMMSGVGWLCWWRIDPPC